MEHCQHYQQFDNKHGTYIVQCGNELLIYSWIVQTTGSKAREVIITFVLSFSSSWRFQIRPTSPTRFGTDLPFTFRWTTVVAIANGCWRMKRTTLSLYPVRDWLNTSTGRCRDPGLRKCDEEQMNEGRNAFTNRKYEKEQRVAAIENPRWLMASFHPLQQELTHLKRFRPWSFPWTTNEQS